MVTQRELKEIPLPRIRPGKIEQACPEMPWSREEAWRRYWTPGRCGLEVRAPRGDAHDAGVFMAIQLWRELMGFDRPRWDRLDGNMVDGYRARLRVGAVCWNEGLLRKQADLLFKVRDNIWKPWEDLVREAAERGSYVFSGSGQRDRTLDIDPHFAARAFANGWIGRRGEMSWDSLVFDGIMLVECGVIENAPPVWGDGGESLVLPEISMGPDGRPPKMRPGIKLYEWIALTGRTAEQLAEEVGVDKTTVSRWRLGQRPHNGHIAALRILSGGLITEESFTPRKPPEAKYVELALRRLKERREGSGRRPGRPMGSTTRTKGLDLGKLHGELRAASSPGLVMAFHPLPDNLLPGMGMGRDEREED